MVNYKRVIISTLSGTLLGIICIVGVGSRPLDGEYLSNFGYLSGIWLARILLGLMIGFVAEVYLIKGDAWQMWVNAAIRGALIGLLFSVMVILLDNPFYSMTTFAAGIGYGLITDLVATFLTREKKDKETKEEKEVEKD